MSIFAERPDRKFISTVDCVQRERCSSYIVNGGKPVDDETAPNGKRRVGIVEIKTDGLGQFVTDNPECIEAITNKSNPHYKNVGKWFERKDNGQPNEVYREVPKIDSKGNIVVDKDGKPVMDNSEHKAAVQKAIEEGLYRFDPEDILDAKLKLLLKKEKYILLKQKEKEVAKIEAEFERELEEEKKQPEAEEKKSKSK